MVCRWFLFLLKEHFRTMPIQDHEHFRNISGLFSLFDQESHTRNSGDFFFCVIQKIFVAFIYEFGR